MIDFCNLGVYAENNRIEAKRAVGGLPHSIWETYSAFANTLGGIILLGVEEGANKTLHPLSLPAPELLVEDFGQLVNDPRVASANLLIPEDISVEEVDGGRIVAIRVRRARRTERPIFVGGDPFTGTYRRGGEGDYKCTPDEVRAMRREATHRPAHPPEPSGLLIQKAALAYLTDRVTATLPELADHIGLTPGEIREELNELLAAELITYTNGLYRLKA